MKWNSIKKKTPDEFQECIVFYPLAHKDDIFHLGGGIVLAEYEENGCFRELTGRIVRPTHWMPKPNDPK